MSDLGTDAGGQLLPAMSKISDLLLKVISAMFRPLSAEARKLRHEIKLAKLKGESEAHILELEKRRDQILSTPGLKENNILEELSRTGVSVVPIGAKMDAECKQNFDLFCKESGIVVSGREMSDGFHLMSCREADLEHIKMFLDIETKERLFRQEMGSGNLENAEAARRVITETFTDDQFLSKLTSSAEDKYLTGLPWESAMNMFKGRVTNVSSEPYVYADSSDPGKYIKCTSEIYQPSSGGKEAVGTRYEVFNGPDLVFSFDDRDISPSQWADGVSDMIYKGGLVGIPFKLHTVKDYEAFRNNIEQSAYRSEKTILSDIHTHEGIGNYFESKLAENGYAVRGDHVVDVKTGDILKLDDNMAAFDLETFKTEEMLVIGKQVKAHYELSALESLPLSEQNDYSNNLHSRLLNEVTDLSNYRAELDTMKSELTSRPFPDRVEDPGFSYNDNGRQHSRKIYEIKIKDRKLSGSSVESDSLVKVRDMLSRARPSGAFEGR